MRGGDAQGLGVRREAGLSYFFKSLNIIFNSKAKTLVLNSSSLHDMLYALQYMPL